MEINEATWHYIRTHVNDNVRDLALRGCKVTSVDFKFALQQIEGRQKSKDKLPDFYQNEQVLYPPTVSMEQCSSTHTANYKASLVAGENFADLTGGFGIDTFALSRRFKHGYHIEPNNALSELVQHNASVLNISNLEFIQDTMEESLSQIPNVDCLYIDPSRRDSHGNRVVCLEDCTPNIIEWKSTLLGKCKKLMIKLSPMIDIKRSLLQLPETSDIYTIAVNGECKEVLLILEAGKDPTDRCIHTINILKDGYQIFETTASEEVDAMPTLTNTLGRYLYEPNAAVLKAGTFKSIATRFGLEKLHPHTHLYTSDILAKDFPGRIFNVDDSYSFNKKEIKKALGDIKKANVAVRNFPLTAEELKALLKIKDGGEVFLFGATLTDGKLTVIQATKADH